MTSPAKYSTIEWEDTLIVCGVDKVSLGEGQIDGENNDDNRLTPASK